MNILTVIIVIIVFAVCVYCFYHHQRLLADRAHLMREAMRNKEFTFRLPVKGLFFGERALQQALNDLGSDISMLVAQNEVESWQKLTRVLTHEIMNATAPISSISQAYLSNPKIKGTIYEEGIRAIHDTSSSLSAFVDSYRKLAQLQDPVMAQHYLRAAVDSVKSLYPNLEWHNSIDSDITIHADENMLRQVLINVVKNAIEAGATIIDLSWNGSLLINNNGSPIPPDVAREMFIPFFTTKQTGSGIGLSLSRQLMVKQGGNLSLDPTPVSGYHATFRMSFETLHS